MHVGKKQVVLSPEVAKLIEEFETAQANLQRIMAGETLPDTKCAQGAAGDQYSGVRGDTNTFGGGSPSLNPSNAGESIGSPLYAMLATQSTFGTDTVHEDGTPFAWDSEADVSLDKISTRKLLDYYRSSMGNLHQVMGRMDFDRKEGFWYERYREDTWRDLDEADTYYRQESAYSDNLYYDQQYYDDLAAADYQFQTNSYYDYDDQR